MSYVNEEFGVICYLPGAAPIGVLLVTNLRQGRVFTIPAMTLQIL